MPVLTIVAGPNGAGKSTHSRDLTADRGIEAFDYDKEFYAIWKRFQLDPFIELGARDRTNEIYEERKEEALALRKNFAFETNFHTEEVLNVVNAFQEKGYAVELVFIFLNSPEQAIDRVQDRVSKGGHSVPANTIRERFQQGLSLLNANFNLFDTVILFQSKDQKPELLAELDIVNKKVISYQRIPNVLQLELPNLQKFISDNMDLGLRPPGRKGPKR